MATTTANTDILASAPTTVPIQTAQSTGSQDASGLETESVRQATTNLQTTVAAASPSAITGLDESWSFGPAITASPLSASPAAQTVAAAVPDQPHRGISPGGKTALIATTTIGGTFILAFLLYALLRRRRGATYSEIIRFRPQSDAIVLTPGPRHNEFTALPIYCESRFSVQSTKRGSWLSFSKLKKRSAPSPSSETFARGPWLNPMWKPTKAPPTPTRVGHPLSQVESMPRYCVQRPEMAHSRSRSQTERVRIKRAASDDSVSKDTATITSREVPSSSDLDESVKESLPDSPSSAKQLQEDSRWSWTNSQAPATPKMDHRSPTRRPSRASTSSLPSFRGRVPSWMKSSGHTVDRIPEEQAFKPAVKQKLPPLKNKASKPVLAPITTTYPASNAYPNRKLSKKAGPPSASILRPRAKSGATEASSTASAGGFSLPLQRN